MLLGNQTLDEIAIDLFKGDLGNLEKNSKNKNISTINYFPLLCLLTQLY